MANTEQLRQFFAEQKVPICLAITDSFMFFEELVDTSILSKSESLELQAGTNSVPRAIYKCLCLIEEKGISVRRFFKILLQRHYLDTFPDLKPILKKYESKQYNISTTISSSKKKLLRRSFKRNKVAIAFAIKRQFPFLQGLQDWGLLSKRQSLILQTDRRPVDRVVYESLCLVEEKGNWFDKFFDYVFQESFLKLYPQLKKISTQHKKEKPDGGTSYKLTKTFQYKKIEICMAVTKKFPFLHGLCDFGFLSESELLSLLADDRQVERVIYKSLCWIEQRKTNFEDFSDFISQDCLRQTYPKLNGISVRSGQIDPGNTERYGICPEELTLILKREKTRISNAISKTFPFMEGLQDRGILSKMESLKLQADGMTAMNTVHKTMCWIEQKKQNFIREFFDYLSQDMYLEMFPKLLTILRSLLKIVKEEKDALSCSGAVKDEGTDWSLSDDQESTNFTSSAVKNENTDDSLSDSNENSNNQPEAEISEALTDSWEDVNDSPMPKIKDVWSDSIQEENTIPPFLERSDLVTDCVEDVNEHSPMPMDSDVTTDSIQEENTDPPFLERSDLVTGETSLHTLGTRNRKRPDFYAVVEFKAEDITDTEESSGDLPSQVHNEVFYVACGNKKGLFLKSKWKGDTSGDICIQSEEELFTVTEFERFGGKASSRNWKKTIKCEGVTLEALMRRGILEPSPSRRKRRSKPHWKKSSVVKGEKSRKLSSCHANDFLNSDDKQNQCESQNESPDAHTE